MAVFQYASEYAHDSLHWAVTEAQKCFNAPLDHTRHHPVEPYPELINAPTGNPYFDRMLKSDTGLKFLELSDPPAGHMKTGEGRLAESPDSKNKRTEEAEPSANLSVVVLSDDGTRTTCKHTITDDGSEPSRNDGSLDDTLTKRSSPNAVAEAVQSVLQQLAASKLDGVSSRENTGTEQRVQLDATYSDSDDEFEQVTDALDAEDNKINKTIRDQEEPMASVNTTREDIAQQTSVAPCTSVALCTSSRDQVSSWAVGSVLEVFSASANSWYPGLVTQIVLGEGALEMLTVQFWPSIDDSKQKTACRESTQFAPIGAHCGDRLPPGFELVFSTSRPGAFVFLDATTGLKYESMELIWAVHFRRWLDRPVSSGMETISSVAPVLTSGPSTRQGGETSASEFGLATQVVPPCESVSAPCSKAPATADERVHTKATDHAIPPAALFLEAMAFESPGEYCFQAPSTSPRTKVEHRQNDAGDSKILISSGTDFEVEQVVAEELLTDEFFASLPEPCSDETNERNLTNLFSR